MNEFVQTRILITQLTAESILQSFQRAAQKVTMIEGWQKSKVWRVDVVMGSWRFVWELFEKIHNTQKTLLDDYA